MRETRGLELDQDLPLYRVLCAVRRVGWGILTIAFTAAILGLFGGGPLSEAPKVTVAPPRVSQSRVQSR